jgi:hypothetical protein
VGLAKKHIVLPMKTNKLSVLQEQGQVDSLIPLLLQDTISVQQAIDHACDILKSSIQRFDLAEKHILEQYSTKPGLQNDLQSFIDSCKHACTANLNWRCVFQVSNVKVPKARGY